MFDVFRFFDLFHMGGVLPKLCFDHSFLKLVFRFIELSSFSYFIIFPFFSINLHHGQGNWLFFKNNRMKILTPTLKKPVLSSSASYTPSASNSTRTYISSQLDNKDITKNQNKNNISNTDDIHSYVTPRK